MQDYGAPVGFRMALAHPERVEAVILQDAVAHNTRLGAPWDVLLQAGDAVRIVADQPRCYASSGQQPVVFFDGCSRTRQNQITALRVV